MLCSLFSQLDFISSKKKEQRSGTTNSNNEITKQSKIKYSILENNKQDSRHSQHSKVS